MKLNIFKRNLIIIPVVGVYTFFISIMVALPVLTALWIAIGVATASIFIFLGEKTKKMRVMVCLWVLFAQGLVFTVFLGYTLETSYPFPPWLGLLLILVILGVTVLILDRRLSKNRFYFLIISLTLFWAVTLLWEIEIAVWAPDYGKTLYELIWVGFSLTFPAYYGYIIPVLSLILMWMIIYFLSTPKVFISIISLMLLFIGIPLFHIGSPWFAAPVYGGYYPNLTLYYIGIFFVPLSWLLLLAFNTILPKRPKEFIN